MAGRKSHLNSSPTLSCSGRWLFVGLRLLALASAAVYTLAFPSSSSAETNLKVGVICSLSGNMSMWGNSIKNGITLAKSTFDPADKIQFLFEDDGFQSKNSVSAAKKLIESEKIQGLIVFGSGPSIAVASVAEQYKLPMIALATSSDVVKNKNYVMKHLASVKSETAAVVKEVERRNYSSLAIITTAQEGLLALREEFISRNTVKVLLDEEVLPEETEVRSIAARVTQLGPSALYLLVNVPAVGVFAKQLRDAGYKGEIFSAHQIEDKREIESSQGALVGSWFVSVNVISDASFEKRYQDMFQSSPGVYAVNAYDVARMFIEGAGKVSLNEYLHTLKDFHGAMGVYGATIEKDFNVPVVLKKITLKGFELL